jgi:hypothetical protein
MDLLTNVERDSCVWTCSRKPTNVLVQAPILETYAIECLPDSAKSKIVVFYEC